VDLGLQGSTVLVTGASKGIGRASALMLAEEGCDVAVNARNPEPLEKTAQELSEATGRKVIPIAGDMSDPDDVERVVGEAIDALGHLDILVTCAGSSPGGLIEELTEEHWRVSLGLKFMGYVRSCKAVLPHMRERRRGHIVNVASLAGKAATPYNTVYAATKHGLIGFTYSLRAELHGTGVSASAVCPAFVSEAGFVASYVEPGVRRSLGTETDPRKVARAVVRVIERDKPDVVVAGALPQIADVSLAIAPRLTEFLARRMGGYDALRREALARARRRNDT
jgi:3-oxoacyl-[acyl-carrier protein] reductase